MEAPIVRSRLARDISAPLCAALALLLGASPAGAVTIDGAFGDWSDADLVGTDVAGDTDGAVDWVNLWARFENGALELSYQTRGAIDFTADAWRYAVFIHVEGATGPSFVWPAGDGEQGAQFLIEGGSVYRYAGSGSDWSWAPVGSATYAYSGDRLEMSLAGSYLGLTATSRLGFFLLGNDPGTPDVAPEDLSGFAFPRGRIAIDGVLSDWSSVPALGTDATGDAASGPVDWVALRALRQAGTLYVNAATAATIDLSSEAWRYNLLLDTDGASGTGYVGLPGGTGAEYLVQGRSSPAPGFTLYRYTGSGYDWNWSAVTSLSFAVAGTGLELAIDERRLGVVDRPLALRLFGDDPAAWDLAPDDGPGYAVPADPVARGVLDSAMGAGGIVTTDFAGGDDVATSVAVQGDGMVVVAGSSNNPAGADLTDLALARYRPDGTLDTGFGDHANGLVTRDFFHGNQIARAVAIQPDGEIVVAGTTTGMDPRTSRDFFVTRFGADGRLAEDFGVPDLVVTDFGGIDDNASAMVLQPDGRIVVVGGGSDGRFRLVRYEHSGALDAGFGTGGQVLTQSYPPETSPSSAYAVALEPDGRIVVAGSLTSLAGDAYTSTGADFAVARYNADGSLDATFGTGGFVTYDFARDTDIARAVAVRPDGTLVAVGDSYVAISGRVRRLVTMIALDATGRVLAEGASPLFFVPAIAPGVTEQIGANGLAILGDGDVVTAGSLVAQNGAASPPLALGPDFALTRFTSTLGLEASFGEGGGIVVTDVGGNDSAAALAVESDGAIIVAGSSVRSGTGSDFALARYR